jgi:DNA-binding transcriptional LysR family regulator
LNLGHDFGFDAVASFPPYAILAPDHRLAKRGKLSIAELIEEPMILLDLPHSREYFRSIFLTLGLEPRIEHRTASPHMVRGLVANGFGYSLLNARLEHDRALDGKPFCAVPLSDKVQPLKVGIVTPANGTPTRAAAAFAEHCHSAWANKRFPCQAAPIPGESLGETQPGR